MTELRAKIIDLLWEEDRAGSTHLNVSKIAARLGVSAIEVIGALDDLKSKKMIQMDERGNPTLFPDKLGR